VLKKEDSDHIIC